jgi:hypothetical protein
MNRQSCSSGSVHSLTLGILSSCLGLLLFCGCNGGGGDDTDNTSALVDVSGTWTEIDIPAVIEYETATMTLSQSGNVVSGTFQDISDYNYGTIDGTINGN